MESRQKNKRQTNHTIHLFLYVSLNVFNLGLFLNDEVVDTSGLGAVYIQIYRYVEHQ